MLQQGGDSSHNASSQFKVLGDGRVLMAFIHLGPYRELDSVVLHHSIQDCLHCGGLPCQFAAFEGRYFSTPKKMGAQTAEANINAGIAAAKQINAFFAEGSTRFQVNKKW